MNWKFINFLAHVLWWTGIDSILARGFRPLWLDDERQQEIQGRRLIGY